MITLLTLLPIVGGLVVLALARSRDLARAIWALCSLRARWPSRCSSVTDSIPRLPECSLKSTMRGLLRWA